VNPYLKDYYGILEVGRDAGPEILKSAYRRLAKRFHPDRKPGDAQAEEFFKELQEAYAVLKDPQKRNQYDALRRREEERGEPRRPASGAKGQPAGKSGMSGLVEDMYEFIRSRMENRGKRGEDLRYLLSLSFLEATSGVKKTIRIPKRKICPSCRGRGWTVAADSPVCQVCRGEGEITVREGKARVVRQCPACGGRGLNEKESCLRCQGQGCLSFRVRRTVEIPAGVDNGSRLRIRGEGGSGEKGGEEGDLYIVIQVKDHPVFKRRHLDVWSEIDLPITQAALGAEIRVQTIKGEAVLKVPPGTQTGTVLNLKGHGVPGLNGSVRGDHKVRLQVKVPKNLTEEEKAFLQSWENVRKKRHSQRP